MKIFISHSSKQRLLVKEIKSYLPNQIGFWIDEHEIKIGEHISNSLHNAITNECDFFIVFIDDYSIKSPWVQDEIQIALKKESELQRPFFLPIIIDQTAWDTPELSHLKSKRFLKCHDFSDIGIEAISKELLSELLKWLFNEFERKSNQSKNNSIDILNNASQLSKHIAHEIKSIVHPYRKSNPLDLKIVINYLIQKNLINSTDPDEFISLLDKLTELNYINGLEYNSNVIYLGQERFSTKSSLYHNAKLDIAKKAFELIEPRQIIALDGGSTTLELTKLICKHIKLRKLYNLSIITNSIPNAFELLTTLGELGIGDTDRVCDIYMTGGHARPVSFTIAAENKSFGNILDDDLNRLFDKIGSPDICFVGANGIDDNFSFANHNKYELRNKIEMIRASKVKVILVDASKFHVKQESAFASLDQSLTIITNNDPKYSESLNLFNNAVSRTDSKLIFC
jgi:DeoR family transcriptional regulator, aga operon transcriptional repressor